MQPWVSLLPTFNQTFGFRDQEVNLVYVDLTDGVLQLDMFKVSHSLTRMNLLLKHSGIILSPDESAKFVDIAMDLALDRSESWVTLQVSTAALNLVSILLQDRIPALVPLVENMVSWEKLLKASRLHSLDITAPEACIASTESLKVHIEALSRVFKIARFYQKPNSSVEIWNEFQTRMYLHSEHLQETQILLFLLYPSRQRADQKTVDDWMHIWGFVDHNATEWDSAWFALLRRLAKSNPHLAFSHHLSAIFGRCGTILNNAESSKATRKFSPWQGTLSRVGISKAAKLIVELLGVGDAVKRLENLLFGLRTWLHPSNQGAHASRLSAFICSLCSAYAKRLGRCHSDISRDVKVRFIKCLYPLIEMGLHSKSLGVVSQCQSSLRHLAWVAPCTISSLALLIVREGLDPSNVTRSHQTMAGMKILTSLISPLIFSNPVSRALILPELPTFLENSLPGLDPNDSRKTAVTLLMCCAVLKCVPLVSASELNGINVPSLPSYGIDENVEVLSSSFDFGNRLQDWGLCFFRKVFGLAQIRGHRAKNGMSAQLDRVIDFFLQEAIVLCFSTLQDKKQVFKEACIFLIEDSALPEAHFEAKAIARALVLELPQACLKACVPALCAKINAKSDAKTVSWSLEILGTLCRKAGHFLLPYVKELKECIFQSFAHKDSKVRYLGCKLIRRLCRGLLTTYPFQNEAIGGKFNPHYDAQMQLPSGIKWHCPSQEEVSCAIDVLSLFRRAALQDEFVLHEQITEKERMNHNLTVFFQLVRGGLTHMDASNTSFSRTLLSKDMLAWTRMIHTSSNIFGLKLCIKSLSLLAQCSLGPRGSGNETFLYSYQAWTSWLRDVSQNLAYETHLKVACRERFYTKGEGSGALPSDSLLNFHERAMLVHLEFLMGRQTYYESFRMARLSHNQDDLHAMLTELCFHPFSAVRQCAQEQGEFVDARFPSLMNKRLLEHVIPKLNSNLPEVFTGAVFYLKQSAPMSAIFGNWEVFEALATAFFFRNGISQLPSFRQAKAQERLAKLFASVLNRWQTFPSRMMKSESVECFLLALQKSKDWRSQIFSLALIAILISSTRVVSRETFQYVWELTRSEMFPTRVASFYVLRRVLLISHDYDFQMDWLTMGTTLGQDWDTDHSNHAASTWSVGVGESLDLVQHLMRLPKFPKLTSSGNTSPEFDTGAVDLYATLLSKAQLQQVAPLLKQLATEGESNKERLERRISACEMFTACLVVHPHWTKELFPILTRMLGEVSNASNWIDAVSYIVCFSSQKTLLLEEIQSEVERVFVQKSQQQEPETDVEQESGFSYTCNLLKILGCALLERRLPLTSANYGYFHSALVHPYKAVRQASASSFALFAIQEMVDLSVVEASFLFAASQGKDGLESSLSFLLVLVSISSCRPILSLLTRMMPLLFSAQGHADVEIALLAKNALSKIASSLKCFSCNPKDVLAFEQILVDQFATHTEWSKRRALCVFLQNFHRVHASFLLGLGAGGLIQKTSENLLLDSQSEVRDCARLLLLSILASVPELSLSSARDRYLRMIAKGESKQQGILALSALVESSPYSIPEAIPSCLVVLSQFVSHPTCGLQVKKTLSEFRRTHIDEWEQHRLHFTEEQLNALEGVLSSPDYYA